MVHSFRQSGLLILFALLLSAGGLWRHSAAGDPAETTRLRRPVAMVRHGSRLFVANRDTGTVSVVDVEARSVAAESQVASRLDDLVSVPGTDGKLLAVDSESHDVILLNVEQSSGSPGVTVSGRVPVSRYPVSLAVSPDADTVTVASTWSRRLTLLDAGRLPDRSAVLQVVDLPFAPLKQLFLSDRFVLVADAHGGELAVVDVESGSLRSWRKLDGHNIRGLALTPDGQDVVISHQILYRASSTTRSIISWGGVISNMLHTISVDSLLNSRSLEASESVHGRLYPLGKEKTAAGDPAGLAIAGDGRIFVALAGVHEVAVKQPRQLDLKRTDVGRGPRELLLHEQSGRLFVLNTFGDSISVLDALNADSLEVEKTIPLGPAEPVRNFVQAGEELFYDARLSLDGWFSCHSCHADGHTTGRLNDNLGDDSFNTPKRILTLLGTADTEPWAWNGRQIDLRNQVRKSIEQTMAGPGKQGPSIDDRQIEALVSYISSLPPAPGILTAREEADRPAAERGRRIFEQQGCTGCHQPSTYSSPLTFDVGLSDEAGESYFNPPSLRGVSQRGPYFHDNRADCLEEVILEHDHDGAASLSEDEATDLVEFLRSL